VEEPRPRASVIVPSYNSKTTIQRCLRSLLAQETDIPHELILIDSSDDGTDELVRTEFPSVQLVRLDQRTLPGRGRNLGAERSRGELLLFTDADCVVEPDWIERLVGHLDQGNVVGIGGSVLNGLPWNPAAWCGYLVEFSEYLPSSPAGSSVLLPTCNAAFRRDTFERLGGFPEELWPAEDQIFSWRLVQGGDRLGFDPTIRVSHLFRPTFSGFLRHQRRLGSASAEARRKVPDLPGAWVATSPLRWLTPLLRLARIEGRLVRSDPANLLRFNLLMPLVAPGLLYWGAGFCFGPEQDNREQGA